MKTYARIDGGVVMELFSTDLDITELFHPELVWIDVTDVSPAPQERWLYDGSTFAEPPPPPEPPPAPEPTKAELLAQVEALLGKVNALPS